MSALGLIEWLSLTSVKYCLHYNVPVNCDLITCYVPENCDNSFYRSWLDVICFQSDLLVVKKRNKRYCPIYFQKVFCLIFFLTESAACIFQPMP